MVDVPSSLPLIFHMLLMAPLLLQRLKTRNAHPSAEFALGVTERRGAGSRS